MLLCQKSGKQMNKKSIISLAIFFYITAVILSTYINLRNDRMQALKFLDLNLNSAMKHVSAMIGKSVIISIPKSSETNMETETDIQNMIELSQFIYQAGLEKAAFLYEKNGRFHYIASSSTDKNLKTGYYDKVNTSYNRERSLLYGALAQDKPVYSSYTDSKGDFRTCAKSILTDDNKKIIVLVSVSTKEIMHAANQSFIKSLLLSIFFMAFLIPIIILILAYDRNEKRDLNFEIYYDSLTFLPNKKMLIKTHSKSRHLTLIIFNIANLKKYNYYYGYTAGNAIVKLISEKLQSWIIMESDNFKIKPVLYKLQMDEFAVVFSRPIDNSQRVNICKSFNLLFSGNCCQLNNIAIPVSIVFSAAYMTPAGTVKSKTIEDLLILCDIAIQNTKKTSSEFTIYSMENMSSICHNENFSITQLVKNSIDNNGIIPYYQPIINNSTGEIEKYESLIRIIDSTGELILPKKFLENARQSNIYPSLTRIMINKTFAEFENSSYDFSINISVEDILNPVTAKYIIDTLIKYSHAAFRCIFEITDIVNSTDITSIIDFTNELQNYNCRVAIDDFGSEFSSFKNVSMVNIDFIKIDPVIIRNIQTDKNSKIIAETIVEYCRKMNIRTIAQFVYNKAIYNEVKNMGIDFSQGNYLGLPVDKVDFKNVH